MLSLSSRARRYYQSTRRVQPYLDLLSRGIPGSLSSFLPVSMVIHVGRKLGELIVIYAMKLRFSLFPLFSLSWRFLNPRAKLRVQLLWPDFLRLGFSPRCISGRYGCSFLLIYHANSLRRFLIKWLCQTYDSSRPAMIRSVLQRYTNVIW